ncbi:hypothetical protein [Haloarchaeobius baliensis]|uniref:hypothetical protein n=1 Tax=Haloarchaeobius baliensis TaxID=1670458 RepID=UPI003F881D01
MDGLPRRRLLARQTGLLTLGALAGCLDDDAGPEAGTETTTDDAAAPDTATDGLDLREANVVGVSVESEDGTYRFDVTLHHDDDGEDGYANWWQVERLDGTRLGRRELLHAHSQQPFTRSDSVEIPAGVTCVAVRGHDQTHGYGGVAMLVTLDSGATRRMDQGPEPRTFDATDCPG